MRLFWAMVQLYKGAILFLFGRYSFSHYLKFIPISGAISNQTKESRKENKVPLPKLRIYDILKVVILYSFRKGKTILEKKEKEISQHEDVAEKVAWQFFKDEVMAFLGIDGKVVNVLSNETIHLELKKMYEDLSFLMEDDTIKHFEFQSTNEGLIGLKRFRVYEAELSYQFKKAVTTYVLYSGKIKKPMTKFTEGINTFQVQPIIMQDQNADEVLEKLQQKVELGEKLTKEDLLPLVLCPLMGGETSQKDRVQAAYNITNKAITEDDELIRKVEAVVYVMADKFLDSVDMKELKEELKMTRQGRMMYEEGIVSGIVRTCKKFGALKDEAVKQIVEAFGKTEEEAEKQVEEYWDHV